MNKRAQDFTRGHYDSHANKHETTAQAQHARSKGPGFPLKHYHNNVKRKLIQRFASRADALLDLACGRGGDIQKWMDAGIAYVKGLDLSPGEIEEARRRFSEQTLRRPGLRAEFEATEDLGRREVRLGREFDVVTCMFAIHYFFASAESLDCFLHNVVINLKEGGYFFGACPDGRLVGHTINTFGRWPDYDQPMLKLHARWEGQGSNFGSGYTCAIGDTVTEGHGESTGSYEYLVFRSTLVGAARRHGLVAISNFDDPELDRLFKEADAAEPCKHFNPKFPVTGDERVDVSLALASKLNMAFCFQKQSAAATPVPAGGTKRALDPAPMPSAMPSRAVQPTAEASKRQRQNHSSLAPSLSPSPNVSASNLTQLEQSQGTGSTATGKVGKVTKIG